jgi:hypothetical protein
LTSIKAKTVLAPSDKMLPQTRERQSEDPAGTAPGQAGGLSSWSADRRVIGTSQTFVAFARVNGGETRTGDIDDR